MRATVPSPRVRKCFAIISSQNSYLFPYLEGSRVAGATKIKIAIPKELADELASDGVAMVQRQSRSAAWQLILSATPAAAVMVTLFCKPPKP